MFFESCTVGISCVYKQYMCFSATPNHYTVPLYYYTIIMRNSLITLKYGDQFNKLFILALN